MGIVVGGADRIDGQRYLGIRRAENAVSHFVDGAVTAGGADGRETFRRCFESEFFGMLRTFSRPEIAARSQKTAQAFEPPSRTATPSRRIEYDADIGLRHK